MMRGPSANARFRTRAATAIARRHAGLARDERGLAAIEFALIGGTLIFGLFNMIDFGRYLYAKMEVQNAAQMGVQLVWNTCIPPNLPATTGCANESAALTTGVQSTSLGTSVAVAGGYPTEGWYCVNGSGALVSVAAITATKPADCTAAGVAANQPADYFVVRTTYTYAPLFTAFSVANVLPTPITSTNYMRMQ